MRAGGIFNAVRRNPGSPDTYGRHVDSYKEGSLGSLSQAGTYRDGIFGRRAPRAAFASHNMQAYSDGALGQTMTAPRSRSYWIPKFLPQVLQGIGTDVITMDAATQAKLQTCSDGCTGQYGDHSAHPDPILLGMCFANCNAQFPPTVNLPSPPPVTVPGPTGPTPVSLPPLPTQLTVPSTPSPAPYVATAVPAAPTSAAPSKLWLVAAGVAAVGAAGYLVYRKKKRGSVAG